jgi:ABC-type branched-subunit amino acid transport system substrate-binding protein
VRWLAVAGMLGLAVLAACGSEEDRSGPQKLDLKIGNLIPLTGTLEQFGKPARRSAELALEEIRKAAAKAGAQHRVTVSHLDYRSEPGPAVEHARDLQRRGTSCIVGAWGGGHTGRLASLFTVPKEILQISPASTADQISDLRDSGYLNRVVPPDRLQAAALVDLMSRELRGVRGKTVNIGALESTYGKNLTESFEELWRDQGGKVGRKVAYRFDQTSLAPQADQLAAGDPDSWVFFDFTDTYTRVSTELANDEDARWTPRKTFATDSLANPRLPSVAPMASDGLRGVAISAPQVGRPAQEFDRRFKQSPGVNRQTFDAQEFDAIVLCYLAAVAAGSTGAEDMKRELRAVTGPPGRKYTWLELDQAIKALEAGADIDYEGVSGPIDLDRNGDPTAGVYDVYSFDQGQMKLTDQIAVPRGSSGV